MNLFKKFLNARKQTKFFILMTAIYLLALVWTTIQSYARIYYGRTEIGAPIVIQIPSEQK